jgi:coiled-coil domain-containing protein 130
MSSLAATQADGYYLPSEYYDSGAYKRKSKNQWWNSTKDGTAGAGAAAAAAAASSKADEVVRFELPYDGICERCQAYIKRGTRFNATKAKVGDYYTTPIYEFRMQCRACPTVSAVGGAIARSKAQEFVLRVNPSEFGFDYVSGIRKHQRDFVAQPDEQCASVEEGQQPRSQTEVLEQQQYYVQRQLPSDLEQLQMLQARQSRSFLDADGNAALRATFRVDRRRKKRQLAGGSALGWRSGLELLEHSTVEETCHSKTAVFGYCRSHDRDKWRAVRTESIFARVAPTKSGSRRKRRQAEEAKPDSVPSAPLPNTTRARRSRRDPTGEVVDLVDDVDMVEYNCDALAPKSSDVSIKKRRMLTVLPTRAVLSVPVTEEAPLPSAKAPVTVTTSAHATAPASSIASLLASYYDSSSSDGGASDDR